MNLSKLHDLNLRLQDSLRMQDLDAIQTALMDMLVEHHRIRDLLRDYRSRKHLDAEYARLGWAMKPMIPVDYHEVAEERIAIETKP